MRWFHKDDSRVSDCLERVAKLERAYRELELDWNNTYDKLRTMMARIAKRAEFVQNHERPQDPEGSDLPTDSSVSPLWSKLTPRQKQIQQQVLQRRANGGFK